MWKICTEIIINVYNNYSADFPPFYSEESVGIRKILTSGTKSSTLVLFSQNFLYPNLRSLTSSNEGSKFVSGFGCSFAQVAIVG